MNIDIQLSTSLGNKKDQTASHKILPANQIFQKRLISLLKLDKPSKERNTLGKIKTIYSNSNRHYNGNNCLRNNKENVSFKGNIHQYNQKTISLQDKIFSPYEFISKNESRNQRILSNLNKQLLLNNTPFLSNSKHNLNTLTSSSPLNSSSKYLPDKSYSNKHKKTLILDLDETLVHSSLSPFCDKSDFILNIPFENKTQTIYVLIRPFVNDFLTIMSKLYEIVIFTASISEYANPLLNKLDPLHKITHRLFREHCTQSNNLFIKDLSKVNRCLKDVIIIDNNPISFAFHKDNGIPILTWNNDKSDCELKKMIPFLEYLAKVEDVRKIIKEVVNGRNLNYKEVNKIIEKYEKGEDDKKEKNVETHIKNIPTNSTSNTTARSSVANQNKTNTSTVFTNIYSGSSELSSRNSNNVDYLFRNKCNHCLVNKKPFIINTSSSKSNYKSFFKNNEKELGNFYNGVLDSKKLTISQTEENIIFPSNDYNSCSPNSGRCSKKEIKKRFFPSKLITNNNSFSLLDETYDRLSNSYGGRFVHNGNNKHFSLSKSKNSSINENIHSNISPNKELLLLHNKINKKHKYFPTHTSNTILQNNSNTFQNNNYLHFKLNCHKASHINYNNKHILNQNYYKNDSSIKSSSMISKKNLITESI